MLKTLKMSKQKSDKKQITNMLIHALISAVVAIGGYFLWQVFNPPIASLFALVIFFSMLIYLELIDRK